MKQFMTAREVAEIMGVSEGKAYGVIRELNTQLKAQGYITIAGKVNRTFFEEKCLYRTKVGEAG
ncbi:MAG: DNA-binding protein [Eubacteriales bacterium]|nr:DNA-binding protein [Eubacteriales bacterium]